MASVKRKTRARKRTGKVRLAPHPVDPLQSYVYYFVHMAEDKQLYTFRIEPSVLHALEAITERDGVPVSEQIRRGIRLWLDAKGGVVPASTMAKRAARKGSR